MTGITFANVLARYLFNTNILWALEATVFLFAWMVLFGACYGFKKNIHIGVDILVAYLPAKARYVFAILSGLLCIAFATLIMIGSWEYWLPFVNKRAWFEVNDIPMPDILRFFEPLLNEGERYEKMPRFIPYAVLPFATTLLLWRSIYATWEVIIKKRDGMIASHDAELSAEQASILGDMKDVEDLNLTGKKNKSKA